MTKKLFNLLNQFSFSEFLINFGIFGLSFSRDSCWEQ